ncbi:unnamed protein product [Rhodiola kirilowii]
MEEMLQKLASRPGIKSFIPVAFLGMRLWPADKLGFTKTAIQAKPDSSLLVISRPFVLSVPGHVAAWITLQNTQIILGVQMWTSSVWPKRPAPPRFGRKLTDTQKVWFHLKQEPLTFVVDCGFIYFLPKPFEEQDESYSCPQCLAPKKRFAKYDVSTGKAIGGGLPPIGVIIGLIAGLGAVGALLVYGLQ